VAHPVLPVDVAAVDAVGADLVDLAADLGVLFPEISRCHIISIGALYDQCQVLRPGMPVFVGIDHCFRDNRVTRSTPGLTALAYSDGAAPHPDLEPDKSIPPGLIRLIPLVLEGPSPDVDRLAEEMEHRFLAEGQVSPHSAGWLESAFGVPVSHARFMTVTDLTAMFRLQLEHFGFLPLWELIDGGLESRSQTLVTSKGNHFSLESGTVCAQFQTFDFWATTGGGRDIDPEKDRLSQAYADLIHEFRQYLTTLEAHQVPVRFEVASRQTSQVAENYLL